MIISMLVNFKLDTLLNFESNKFRLICYQIDMFVKAYMPRLHSIFVKIIQLSNIVIIEGKQSEL